MESAAAAVDGFIVVDGAYDYFPYHGDCGASDDGTVDIVSDLMLEWDKPVEFVRAPRKPWESEMVKRSAYFDRITVGDWAFVIDCDERLVFGHNYFAIFDSIAEVRPFDKGVVLERFVEGTSAHYGTTARVFRKLSGTRYGVGHSHVIHDEPAHEQWRELFLPIVLEENHAWRPKERNALREEFYKSGRMK